LGYTDNAGRAKSQGLELSAQYRPFNKLTISGWASWDDAVLKDAFPITIPGVSVYGVAGDRLPYSSRFSGNISIDQGFRVSSEANGFVGATLAYVGSRVGVFQPTPDRQIYPAYTQIDLRASATWQLWKLDLFANNVTDKRGLLSGGIPAFSFQYITPRTIGFSVARTF
jgi:outer membrane receptor protein involved in Fe transport